MNRHFFSGDRGAKKREWADRTLGRFGARLITVCRFIPGGRTTQSRSPAESRSFGDERFSGPPHLLA